MPSACLPAPHHPHAAALARYGLVALVLLVGLGWGRPLGAQHAPVFSTSMPVLGLGGDTLTNPWAGGLNAPQFSTLDVDADGDQDLFVYDRADRFLGIFRHQGPALGGGINYRFHGADAAAFPLDQLGQWALLRDYNGDGRQDLFTERISNIRLFKQGLPSPHGTPTWQKVADALQTRYPTSGTTALYCSNTDIPGLADIDFDGDLDVLTMEANGNIVEYHRNLAQDSSLPADSIRFVAASRCWGHFIEFYDFGTKQYNVNLNQTPCPGEFKTSHIGATILPINLNGDTLMDAVIGDYEVPITIAVVNGGTRRIAHMTQALSTFPPGPRPLNLPYFPGLYYLDVTGDGVNDLLAAPNEPVYPQDRNNVWLYTNQNRTDSPAFVFAGDNFLGQTMIDLGTGASPAWFDYNHDGKPDLVVGRDFAATTLDAPTFPTLFLYENVGTAAQPAFRLVTNNYLGLEDSARLRSWGQFKPAFGDLDNDGDDDLLLGIEYTAGTFGQGRLVWFRNTTPANPPPGTQATFELAWDNLLHLNQERALTERINEPAPHLADLDGDGDDDLVLGNTAGNLWVYRNLGRDSTYTRRTGRDTTYLTDSLRADTNIRDTYRVWVTLWDTQGTVSAPGFRRLSQQWGQVSTIDTLFSNTFGNSAPWVADGDHDGKLELYVGAANGTVLRFADANLPPTGDTVTTPLPHLGAMPSAAPGGAITLDVGANARPALYPARPGDTLRYVVGTKRGGLMALQDPDTTHHPDSLTATPPPPTSPPILLQAYPNPARDVVNLVGLRPGQLEVWAPSGQLWQRHTLTPAQLASPAWPLSLQGAPTGLLLLRHRPAQGQPTQLKLLHLPAGR